MKKVSRRKLVLQVEDDFDHTAYQTPSMKKAEEDRNKVIPNYVMEAVRSAFQKKLSNFFADPAMGKEPLHQESIDSKLLLYDKPASGLEDAHAAPLVGANPVQQKEQQPEPEPVEEVNPEPALTIEKLIGAAAVNISREVKANCIVTMEKGDSEVNEFNFEDVKVAIFKQIKKGTYKRFSYNTKMKRQQGSVLPIKELLMEAVNKNYIGKGDKIIFVGGDSIGPWLKGFFFILDVDKVFFNISTHHLTEKVSPDIIEAIISLAMEISSEGREGRSIGTAFVVGNKDELLKYTKPLLKMNPLGSLPEDARNIIDVDMKETLKNLAQLDGVFLIDETGTVLTAGAYINIDQNNLDLQGLQGFGTRHRCTAAITKLTDSIGVVVSSSGGTVRIFKDGKAILKLP
ncbi:DNA integrity scanning protein DisA nucleotide-binding domain protein [Candidatus Woesearchaeota archaeon]|nr:DNA integrity scanning protein DisA nucleotide-binding domain protein [Candidatus Woesearchaeota archaeon]